jgi:hypothetical protein
MIICRDDRYAYLQRLTFLAPSDMAAGRLDGLPTLDGTAFVPFIGSRLGRQAPDLLQAAGLQLRTLAEGCGVPPPTRRSPMSSGWPVPAGVTSRPSPGREGEGRFRRRRSA